MKLSISMTREETTMGWLFLSIQLFFLPRLLLAGNAVLGQPLSDAALNFLMFAINFSLAVLIFHPFLRKNFKNVTSAPFRFLQSVIFGLVGYYLVDIVLKLLIRWIFPEFSNSNDSAIVNMTRQNLILMAVGMVLLVPLVEEALYRGLIFRILRQRNRVAAYLISVSVFSLIHIINYISTYSPLHLVISFLQYIPAGIFLAYAYEKADSIWAPISMHMTINLIALTLTR